jgi:type I restriction enzyme S subunit
VKARLGWKGLKAEEYVPEGPIFLATPNLRGGRIDFNQVDHLSQWRYEESPEIQLAVGDVLLVKDGSTLGISAIVRTLPAPTTVNGSIAVIRPAPSLASGFLFYSINGQRFQRLIWLKRAGLGVPHLFQADLREFEIPLPPVADQNGIAEILSTLDDTIEQTEALIGKYQQTKAGLMQNMFTRGVTSDGHLRPTNTQAPQLYKESPLGPIPKEWEISTCGDEFELKSGITLGPHRRPSRKSHPYLRVANVFRDRIVLDDVARIEVFPGEVEANSLRTFDLLVVEGHASRNEIGRCAMVYYDAEGMLFQNHLFRLRPIRLDSWYALFWLNSHHATRYWEINCATSSGLNTINRKMLGRMPICVAPPKEQRRIVEALTAHREAESAEKRFLDKLRNQKQGLMHDLLTGRVRAKATEPEEVTA